MYYTVFLCLLYRLYLRRSQSAINSKLFITQKVLQFFFLFKCKKKFFFMDFALLSNAAANLKWHFSFAIQMLEVNLLLKMKAINGIAWSKRNKKKWLWRKEQNCTKIKYLNERSNFLFLYGNYTRSRVGLKNRFFPIQFKIVQLFNFHSGINLQPLKK